MTTFKGVKEGLDHTNQEPGAGLQGYRPDPVLNGPANDSEILRVSIWWYN